MTTATTLGARRGVSTWATGVALAALIALGVLAAPELAIAQAGNDEYEPTWESVDQHEPAPEWFKDAKFGIYMHWGVYTTPQFGYEWYPREMYLQGGIAQHHASTYGPPDEWPYHNFIEGANNAAGDFVQFHPELASEGGQFDPDEWGELIASAGAQFAGMVAEHHDGISLWDSEVNEWNTADKGPELDLMGLVSDAIRGEDMKLFISMHHAFNHNGFYYQAPQQSDPSLQKLYGQLPREEMDQLWLDKLKEVVDRAQPDILYQDFSLDSPGWCIEPSSPCVIDEQQRLNFLAYYYNQANEWDKEVVTTFKHFDSGFNTRSSVADWERGGPADITRPYWLTDDAVSSSSWSYTNGMSYYSSTALIHALIDRVSKNGNMILNISPTAVGVIPQGQRNILQSFGAYLDRYGESIYETRAWEAYGEGPTQMGGGIFTQPQAGTPEDIRFTRNKANDVLYATILGWPGDGETLEIDTLGADRINLEGLQNVQLLGDSEGAYIEIDEYDQDADSLDVTFPGSSPVSSPAYVLKLSFDGAIPTPKPAAGASVYEEPNYLGPSATLPTGDYTADDLADRGVTAASITSLRVADGFELIAYPEDDFQGTPKTYTGDVPELDAGPAIGSLRITAPVAYDLWDDHSGAQLDDIPDETEPDTSDRLGAMEAPSGVGDSIGTRLRAVLVPPEDGDYQFWLASDDQGTLLLSRDAAGNGRRELAYVDTWSEERNYDQFPSQQSEPVTLEAGKRYLIEAYAKEGSGGDHLSAAWAGPGFERELIGAPHLEAADAAGCSGWCPVEPLDLSQPFTIANVANGFAIDGDGVTTSGSEVPLHEPDGGATQVWRAIDADDGYHRLENSAEGLVLDGAGGAEGSSVVQSTWTGGVEQQWELVSSDGRTYSILNRDTGLALDGGGAVPSGSPLKQWTPNGSANLQWRLSSVANAPPVIDEIAADPLVGDAPLEVSFTAAASDADGDEVTYGWDFGDGNDSMAQNPTHVYEEPGSYLAELTVSDGLAETSESVTVNVHESEGDPAVDLTAMPSVRRVGKKRQRVTYRARAKNVGDAPTGKVSVCANVPSARLRVVGPQCRTVADLAPGERTIESFKFRIKRRARGTESRIRFVARGTGITNQRVAARLIVRR